MDYRQVASRSSTRKANDFKAQKRANKIIDVRRESTRFLRSENKSTFEDKRKRLIGVLAFARETV